MDKYNGGVSDSRPYSVQFPAILVGRPGVLGTVPAELLDSLPRKREYGNILGSLNQARLREQQDLDTHARFSTAISDVGWNSFLRYFGAQQLMTHATGHWMPRVGIGRPNSVFDIQALLVYDAQNPTDVRPLFDVGLQVAAIQSERHNADELLFDAYRNIGSVPLEAPANLRDQLLAYVFNVPKPDAWRMEVGVPLAYMVDTGLIAGSIDDVARVVEISPSELSQVPSEFELFDPFENQNVRTALEDPEFRHSPEGKALALEIIES